VNQHVGAHENRGGASTGVEKGGPEKGGLNSPREFLWNFTCSGKCSKQKITNVRGK